LVGEYGLNLDEIISNFPQTLLSGTQEVVNKISSDLRKRNLVMRFNQSSKEFKVISTDGSNVIVERRGGAISLFSVVSLVYSHRNNKDVVESVMELDPSQTLFVIIPKYSVISRANILMRAFEYLVTCSILDKNNEIDYVLLDGSFSSVLLDPMRIILPIYDNLRYLIPSEDLRASILLKLSEKIKDKMIEFSNIDPLKLSSIFLSRYYQIIEDIIENFMNIVPEGAKITFQHYAISVLEQSFAGMALSRLIEKANSLKKPVIWISKDSESRILSKKYGIFGLFNDLTLLDFILRKDEYLVLNDFIDIPPINERRLRFISRIDDKKIEIPIIARDLISAIYSNYGYYKITYVKFLNFVIQLSFPTKLGNYIDDLSIFLSNLRSISKLGYPEPLIITHYRTKINQRLIENISEGLYEKCKERRNDILCNAISDSGRRKIGL